MIKCEGVENKYLYDKQTLNNIIEMLESPQYVGDEYYTQENISVLVNEVNSFINSITPIGQKVMLERHETEEEARRYFGPEFIEKFDRLMTILDKQQTIVALHGTQIENCPLICANGLQYENTSLFETTVRQEMAFGQSDIHYKDYEKLLNWPHEQKKGIVILAIPYECHYREGLWNQFQNTDTAGMGGQDYRIDSDFVVGYLDVKNKNIVLNPKYNRQHNYEGYIKDTDIFHKNQNMNNETFAQNSIAWEQKKMQERKDVDISDDKEQQRKVSLEEIENLVEDMRGTFNAIRGGSPNGMNERAYKQFLGELANNFRLVQQVFPLLKTNEQLRLKKELEKAEEEKRWAELCKNASKEDDLAWAQWENIEWGEPVEQEIDKSL